MVKLARLPFTSESQWTVLMSPDQLDVYSSFMFNDQTDDKIDKVYNSNRSCVELTVLISILCALCDHKYGRDLDTYHMLADVGVNHGELKTETPSDCTICWDFGALHFNTGIVKFTQVPMGRKCKETRLKESCECLGCFSIQGGRIWCMEDAARQNNNSDMLCYQ